MQPRETPLKSERRQNKKQNRRHRIHGKGVNEHGTRKLNPWPYVAPGAASGQNTHLCSFPFDRRGKIRDKMDPEQQGNSRLSNGRFAPGKSGNPKGRPHQEGSLTALLKEQIRRKCPGDKQGRTWREVLVLACLSGALKNPVLMKEVLERVDGKVLQAITGPGGGPLQVIALTELARVARDGEKPVLPPGTVPIRPIIPVRIETK